MAATLIFLTLSLVVVIGISSPIASQIRNSSLVLQTRKSVTAAETMNDDALYRLNSGRTLPATMVLALNDSTSTAQITDVGGAKQIISIGEFGNTERVSKSTFSQGSGVSISYGLQVGNGGLTMNGGPTIYGNAYSNGNITASGGSTITGSASAAAYLSASPLISNGTDVTPWGSVDVGKTNNVQLIAQSFQVPVTSSITSFNIYVKKSGAPANGTLKIYNSNGSNVGTTQIGSSGTLSAALVNGQYDWIEIYPTAPITLTANTTYWLTFEYQGSNVNYYTLGANDNTYGAGSLKLKNKTGGSWGAYYDATPGTKDIYFSMTTGVVSTISGITIQGSANAAVINNSTVNGNLYCQSGTSNNKACDDTQPLPSSQPMPISSANIQAWKDEASSGTIRNSSWDLGNDTSTSTPGAMKIVGDLTVRDGATLTITGPLYVTGRFKIEGGARVKLASSYGTGDEVIVVQSFKLSGGGTLNGSGTAGSYVTLVADSANIGGVYAGEAEGGTSAVVYMAPFGTIKFSGGASAKAAVANAIIMEGGTSLVYEAGLASITFNNGPSGAWNVNSWKEI